MDMVEEAVWPWLVRGWEGCGSCGVAAVLECLLG